MCQGYLQCAGMRTRSRAGSLLKECPVRRVPSLPHSSVRTLRSLLSSRLIRDAIVRFQHTTDYARCDMSNREIIKIRYLSEALASSDQQIHDKKIHVFMNTN